MVSCCRNSTEGLDSNAKVVVPQYHQSTRPLNWGPNSYRRGTSSAKVWRPSEQNFNLQRPSSSTMCEVCATWMGSVLWRRYLDEIELWCVLMLTCDMRSHQQLVMNRGSSYSASGLVGVIVAVNCLSWRWSRWVRWCPGENQRSAKFQSPKVEDLNWTRPS